MTDTATASNANPLSARPNVAARFDDLGRVIVKGTAIVTAMISVAVPLTEYIRGYTNQRISEAERTSKLASDFLDRIAGKDVSGPDRMLYFGALANLNG